MKLLISDANVIIDLFDGDIIDHLFSLPFDFAVPDALYEFELRDYYPDLPDRGLLLLTVKSENTQQSVQLNSRYPKTSSMDCLALTLAMQETCPLLSGDKALRLAAKDQGVAVHGTVWLVEQCTEHRLLTNREAKQAFERMRERGSRLPWKVIEERFQD